VTHLAVPTALQMREAVRAVASMFPTAIISGRGREKVESFVQLPELYYAGSHGMDIIGPRGAEVNGAAHGAGEPFRFQAAAEYQPLIDRVYTQLRERCARRCGWPFRGVKAEGGD
jgi:trehalose 6-phosphate phosphatase